MLQALLEVGVDAYGIEPFGYEYLQQNGYKVYRSIEELPKGISFSGIISLEVIEHIPVPWNDYRDLKKFLVKEGWLYVSTPNAGGVNAQFTQKKWREIYKRGHLFFFKPATLEYALRESGYKNIKRLRWFINYGRGPLTSIFHWLLQLLMYDGELRYLGFNL